MKVSEAIRSLFFIVGVAVGSLLGYTIGTVQVDRKEESDEQVQDH